jgi:hypothetical protein
MNLDDIVREFLVESYEPGSPRSGARRSKSTSDGANDTQRASGELARMAAELQSLVARFKSE